MHEGHRQRLRERYCAEGLKGFAEHEILELLLTYAIPRRNTNDIAHKLLARFGSLNAALGAKPAELQSVEGIGHTAAVFLSLLGDVRGEYSIRKKSVRPHLNTPQKAALFAMDLLERERYECAYAISLDKNYRLQNAHRLSSGTIAEVPLYPRLVVESALQNRAYAVLLLHNHPSGNLAQSEGDIQATEDIKRALNSIDIRFYDHIVVGHGLVYSYKGNCYIDAEGKMHAAIKDALSMEQKSAQTCKAAEAKQ